MHRLIDFSLRNKFLVLVFTAVLVGFGVRAMLRLPISEYPEVVPPTVVGVTFSCTHCAIRAAARRHGFGLVDLYAAPSSTFPSNIVST